MTDGRENEQNLGQRDTTKTQLFNRIKEKSLLEENATKVFRKTYGESFIVGDPNQGVVGTHTGTESGNQLVVGNSGRTETIAKILNPNNIHREHFCFSRFNDSGTTTGTWDTGNQRLELTIGEVAQSLQIAKEGIWTEASMVLEGDNVDNVTPKLAADGSSFESVTLGVAHTFSTTGTDLRWQLEFTSSNQFPMTFPFTFESGTTTYIKTVKIQYS